MRSNRESLHKENSGEEIIDLKRYLIILYHKKWIVLLFVLFFVGLATVYSLLKPPVYEGAFSIYYKEIVNTDDPTQYTNVKGSDSESEYWLKIMNTPRMLELTEQKSGVDIRARKISDIFTVNREKKDNKLYNVKVTAEKAEYVPLLADAYVESLNQVERENVNRKLSSLLSYLKQQVEENKRKLKSTNKQIHRFSNELNISDITDREQLKVVYNNYKKNLKDLNIKLSSIVAEKEETEKGFQQLKDTLFYETSFSEPLKVQLMNLKIDLARALTRYQEEHPFVVRIKGNIKKVQTLLKQGKDQNVEIKNLSANPIKRDLLARLSKIKIEEQSLMAEIEATEEIIAGFNNQMSDDSDESGIQQLLAQREQLVETQKKLNNKIIDTDTYLRSSTNNFVTIYPAGIPEQESNKATMFYIIIGLFAGLLFGVGFIVILDLLDNRIKILADVENYYNINILGSFIHRKKDHELASICKQESADINKKYYRELTEVRINLDQLMHNKAENLISVVSPFKREGKSTSVFLLATEYARSKKKVLLIDLDTFLPKLTKSLGMVEKKGLQDFLLSDTPLNDCIHKSKFENIDIMGCGNNPYDNQIFYDNEKFDELLKEVSKRYDKVILDTPGLLFFPEIASILRKMSYVIIVTRLNRTTRFKLDNLIRKLNTLSTKILGTILTDVHASPFATEYSYMYNKYYAKKKRHGSRLLRRRAKYTKYANILILLIGCSTMLNIWGQL